MPVLTIAELPFRERPVLELLALLAERAAPDHDYAGYGWARVDRLWLATGDDRGQPLDDALVLALHSADDGEPLADDIELEFELPGEPPVAVLASLFLDRWLPRLPSDRGRDRARAVQPAPRDPAPAARAGGPAALRRRRRHELARGRDPADRARRRGVAARLMARAGRAILL